MSVRVGLGIGATEVRAVMVRRGDVVWRGSAPTDSADAIAELLRGVPLPSRGRVVVVAAIGPSLVQMKQLLGVPVVNDVRLLDEMARQNAGRFFLRGDSLVTTVWRNKAGAVWCAAFDTAVLRAITAACDGRRLHFVGAIPTAFVLGTLVNDGRVEWPDGRILLEIEARGGLPHMVRRRRRDADTPVIAPPTVQALGTLADAYGAATCGLRAPLLWQAAKARPRVTGRIARTSSIALVTLAAAGTVLAPGVRASMVARSARPAFAVQPIAQLNADLRIATNEIDRIESFAASRRSVSRLLSGLAEVLPESAAIVSLRVDSAGASMVTLSRRAADIVPQLREVKGVAVGTISGTATRETMAGTSLERATIKLAFRKP